MTDNRTDGTAGTDSTDRTDRTDTASVGPQGPTVALGQLLVETEGRLVAAGITNASNEATWILEEVTGFDRVELASANERPATVRQVAQLDALVARRGIGEPLQYVLGHWSFRRLDLAVDARALIPRPETESVVEIALAELDALATTGSRTTLAVDLGTGTGAIALSLATERPHLSVVATDISEAAVALARANLAGIGSPARRVRLAVGAWWAALEPELAGTVDLVVSNPPYIPDDAPLDPVVQDWEPVGALRSGADGLNDLRTIIAGAPRWLRPGGALVVEIGDTQGEAVCELATAAGLTEIAIHDDLAGRPRALAACRA